MLCSDAISRRGLAALAAGALALALVGCSGAPVDTGSAAGSAATDPVSVRVASLKGPTSIGLVALMDEAAEGGLGFDCEFDITTAADEIVPRLIKGEVDIALIPANLASVVYNKTDGAIAVADINTLGVLHAVTGDTGVSSFSDLAGKTVYLTGKGTTPEYAMRYLLEQSGISDQVTLEFKAEAAEVVSVLAADPTAVGVLPEPFKTAALAKNDALVSPFGLSAVWDEVAGGNGSQMVTGVTVVRSEFAKEHPDIVERFVAAHADSAEAVTGDPAAWAPRVVDAGIVDAAPIAQKAIPGCNIVCMTGDAMKDALSGYLEVLYNADPASVGGALPGEDFYLVDVAR